EIGQMAKAVLVFRDTAVANIRLERSAADARLRAEEERQKSEEEALAKDRARVSSLIGAVMAKLADKDLTFRLEDELPQAYATLR
ncbi:hypothetical protein ABTM57_20295, partial [Acinetobacter baumannii]